MLGAASGAVAGLVAITPAAGNVGLMGAIVIGFVAGFACLWGVHGLKKMLGADDSLDVFGVHGVGGIVGALLTGVFNTPGARRPRPGRRLGHGDRRSPTASAPQVLDPAQGRGADHRVVGRGVLHRLQDRRPDHRSARDGRRRARRPRHLVARRNRLQPLTPAGPPRAARLRGKNLVCESLLWMFSPHASACGLFFASVAGRAHWPKLSRMWTTLDDSLCELGESPFWHPGERALYWLDIPGRAVLRTRGDIGADADGRALGAADRARLHGAGAPRRAGDRAARRHLPRRANGAAR